MDRYIRQTDPQAVGEYLLWIKKNHPDFPMSYLADTIPWPQLPEVDKGASLCQETVRQYRAELEEREDKYAKAALRDIDAGEGIKGYDEAGN